MGVRGVTLNNFFYSVHADFLLLMRGDSFLRIQIFTKNSVQSDAKSQSLVEENREFCEITTYLCLKVAHLKISTARNVHIFH